MNTTSLRTIAKESVGWSIGLSILMLVAGIFAIVVPPVVGIGVAIVVGWLLMLSGACGQSEFIALGAGEGKSGFCMADRLRRIQCK